MGDIIKDIEYNVVKPLINAVIDAKSATEIEREKRAKEARLSIADYEYTARNYKTIWTFIETYKYNSERGDYDRVFIMLHNGKENNVYNIDKAIREGSNLKEQDVKKSMKLGVDKLNEYENEQLIKKTKTGNRTANKQAEGQNQSADASNLNNNNQLNLKKLVENKKPFFIKSYYAFDSLTPYVNCYITTPELKLIDDTEKIKSVRKNYFEIPYNSIKSLEIEFDAAPGVASKFTLKIEDSTGIMGNIMVAQLYSIGTLKHRDGMPKINIEFGWADKHLKKLTKKQQQILYYKNFLTNYMITDTDIEFSEKFKQEVTLKGHQDQAGLAQNIEKKFSPYKVIGRVPVESLRVLQYYHYFKKNESNNYGLNIFKDKSTESGIVKKFINLGQVQTKNVIEKNENFLIASCKQKNNFFNHLNPQDTKHKEIKESFKPFINRTTFHPYLIFCYVLNQYVNQIRDFYSEKENIPQSQKTPTISYLCYFDEKNIKGFKQPTINFDDYCIKDVTDGVKKNDSFEAIGSDILIQEDETWGSLLQRFASKVKLISKDNKKTEPNLYIEINRFIPFSENKKQEDFTEEDDKFKGIGLKNFPIERLISKFNKIIEFYKNNKNNKNSSDVIDKIQKEIGKIKDKIATNTPIIYIIITGGSPFLTEENYVEKQILQSYTVFPKFNSDDRLEYQNFNSGSKNLLDGSYPDVISFRPKINLKDIINANFTADHPVNFNNGIVTFKNEKFNIKNQELEEEKKDLSKNIKSLIDNLTVKQEKKNIIELESDGIYYKINKSKISFYHEGLSREYSILSSIKQIDISNSQKDIKIIELFSSVVSSLKDYSDKLKLGYHFSILNSLLKKSKRVFPGNNNTADFYAYANSANEYNKLLNIGAVGFEAELKILGEPAFTFDWGSLSHILINVNNFDGSPNYLLSGIYSLKKIKHTIESGKFETTLTLMYDSAWGTE